MDDVVKINDVDFVERELEVIVELALKVSGQEVPVHDSKIDEKIWRLEISCLRAIS